MNKILNFLFIICIPCYIWDLYDFIYLGDRSFLIYIALICLTCFLGGEIAIRVHMYKKFGTIWY